MAIIFNNKKDYFNYAKKAAPDKVSISDKDIATQILAKVNSLKEKAEKEGYPFEYVPEKNEYCFLVSNGYKDEGFINDDLQDLYKDNCKELQKNNFSFDQTMLVIEELKTVPDVYSDKFFKSHIILNDGKEHTNSELNAALYCSSKVFEEC